MNFPINTRNAKRLKFPWKKKTKYLWLLLLKSSKDKFIFCAIQKDKKNIFRSLRRVNNEPVERFFLFCVFATNKKSCCFHFFFLDIFYVLHSSCCCVYMVVCSHFSYKYLNTVFPAT